MPRDALFDLAVERALSYALRLRLDLSDARALREDLELWYLKTRFAYRISLDEVVSVLQRYPGAGQCWRGGKAGAWREL